MVVLKAYRTVSSLFICHWIGYKKKLNSFLMNDHVVNINKYFCIVIIQNNFFPQEIVKFLFNL